MLCRTCQTLLTCVLLCTDVCGSAGSCTSVTQPPPQCDRIPSIAAASPRQHLPGCSFTQDHGCLPCFSVAATGRLVMTSWEGPALCCVWCRFTPMRPTGHQPLTWTWMTCTSLTVSTHINQLQPARQSCVCWIVRGESCRRRSVGLRRQEGGWVGGGQFHWNDNVRAHVQMCHLHNCCCCCRCLLHAELRLCARCQVPPTSSCSSFSSSALYES